MTPSLKDIIAQTDNYNFHSHTQYCDGRFTMDEFAAAAAAAGLEHYGFSPHSPVPVESPCNMSEAAVAEYLDTVARLNDMYRGKVKFYAGMEIDYLGEEWGASAEYFRNLPLDYRISSIHFIPSLVTGEPVDVDGSPTRFIERMASCFDGDIRYVVDTFFDHTEAMINAGGFDIIGHFDKIGLNASAYSPGIENEKWYDMRVSRIIDMLRESDLIVEINTKAYESTGRFFPHQRYWQQLADAGCTLMVNSDAHFTDRILASRAEALAHINKLYLKDQSRAARNTGL